VSSGGSYGSSSLQQEIGLGNYKNIHSIKIYWPSSEVQQEFSNVKLNNFYKVKEDSDELILINRKKINLAKKLGKNKNHSKHSHKH
jgi:hypothetical protein